MQELAVLGANDTNTTDDAAAIDAEFQAIAVEFNRLLENATYKGKALFNTAGAFQDKVSLGGRGAEMAFGMGNVTTTEEYAALYVNKTKIDYENAITEADDTARDDGDTRAAGAFDSALLDDVGNPLTYADLKVAVADTDPVEYTYTTGVAVKPSDAGSNTGMVTGILEAIQGKLNTARVEAGSQYAALESSVNYTTDLTAQYELGYNTVNDVNFSMETAHLAKNQILQQAATAMLSQANQGQQGLLQLIQG
jgi:flagellin